MVEAQIEKEENLIVEVFDAAAADITAGTIVTPYGSSGLTMAVTTDKGPYFMAMMPPDRNAGTTARSLTGTIGTLLAYDYSEDGTDKDVPCVVAGVVQCAIATASDIDKGEYVETTATAGHVGKSDYTNWYEIVGIAMEAISSASTSGLVLLGHYP